MVGMLPKKVVFFLYKKQHGCQSDLSKWDANLRIIRYYNRCLFLEDGNFSIEATLL